jgi:hypothetical protein
MRGTVTGRPGADLADAVTPVKRIAMAVRVIVLASFISVLLAEPRNGSFGTVITGNNDAGGLTGSYMDQAGNMFGFVAVQK